MSLFLLMAMTAAVAASMGFFSARRNGAGRDADEPEPGPDAKPSESPPLQRKAPRAAAPAKVSPYAGLPVELGDVLVSAHEERWLAGAVIAREAGRVIGVLFLAPEGAKLCAVAVFEPPRQDLYWMDPADIEAPGEPPATAEIGGTVMRRISRLPVELERAGQGAPRVAEAGIWAAYEGGGREVGLVIAGGGQTFAWKGTRLDEGEYDRLGAGGEA